MGGILNIYWGTLLILLLLLLFFGIPILGFIKLKKADKSPWTAKEFLEATMEKMQMNNKVVYNDEFINDYVDKNSGDLHLNNKLANSKNLICVSKVYQLIIDSNKKVKRGIIDIYFVYLLFSILVPIAGIIIGPFLIYKFYLKNENSAFKNYIKTIISSTNFTENQKDAIQFLVYNRFTLELFKIIYLIIGKNNKISEGAAL